MAKVIWTESAIMDLGSIVCYISLDSPVYARRIGFKIIAATKNLEQFPLSGRKVPEYDKEVLREVIFGSYRIIYSTQDCACYVLAIIHASRDLTLNFSPGDWIIE